VILKTALAGPESVPVLVLGSLGGYVLFKCECGNQFFLRETNSFDNWMSVKCSDCKRREKIMDHVGERYVLKRIRSDAARNNREFALDLQWIIDHIHKPCHYCGRVDTNSITVKSKVPGKVLIKDFRYNGVDRVQNEHGYILDNCVPCCFVCNRAKQSMTYEEFMEWIRNLVAYRTMW